MGLVVATGQYWPAGQAWQALLLVERTAIDCRVAARCHAAAGRLAAFAAAGKARCSNTCRVGCRAGRRVAVGYCDGVLAATWGGY